MKKSSTILWGTIISGVIIFLIIFLAFLNPHLTGGPNTNDIFSETKNNQTIIGNGTLFSKITPITPVNSINVSGKFAVNLNQDKTSQVSITTDENILPYIKLATENNNLYVSTPQTTIMPSKINEVIISTPNFSEVTLGGNIRLDADNINTDKLTLTTAGKSLANLNGNIKSLRLNLAGNSEVKVNVINADTINLKIGGKAVVILSGKVKNLAISTGGDTTIISKNLLADHVTISGAGMSNIKIHAIKTLSVSTAGMSNILYYGNPKISKTSVGQLTLTPAQ